MSVDSITPIVGPGVAEVAYGTECMWWGRVSAARPSGSYTAYGRRYVTLRCPYCGGRCETHATEASFLEMARRFELLGFARHRDMVLAIRGRCFKTRSDAWSAYENRRQQVSTNQVAHADARCAAPHAGTPLQEG